MMFPRTDIGHARAYAEVQWLVGFHKKPYWLYAKGDDYIVSLPRPSVIADGTTAVQYGPGMEVEDQIAA